MHQARSRYFLSIEFVAIKKLQKYDEQSKKMHAVWKADPNWRGSVACQLITYHTSYREGASELLEIIDKLESSSSSSQLQSHLASLAKSFKSLNQYLHVHHSLEESYMFPTINKKFGTNVDILFTDHEEMRQIEQRILSLLKQMQTKETDSALKSLRQEVDSFCRLLLEHLNREEETTVPHLLKITHL